MASSFLSTGLDSRRRQCSLCAFLLGASIALSASPSDAFTSNAFRVGGKNKNKNILVMCFSNVVQQNPASTLAGAVGHLERTVIGIEKTANDNIDTHISSSNDDNDNELMVDQAVVDVDQGLNSMMDTNGMVMELDQGQGQYQSPEQSNERYRAITLQGVDKIAEKHPEIIPLLDDIKLSGLIFPFKASPYFVDELIDWSVGSERIRDDPFYRLVFPTLNMLSEEHRKKLVAAKAREDPVYLMKVVGEIRSDLNPHPAGQKTLNVPKANGNGEKGISHAEKLAKQLTGVQHKYRETTLVFPAAAQTCHAYCTYCFRWAQFIGNDELRFAQKEAGSLFEYLADHQEVSDILMTGGDPMIMQTRSLKMYLEPLCDPYFLPHVKNIRIGTRSLSFWPQRFTTDKDADELIELMHRVREEGGRHFAVMAHLSHARELSTQKVKDAVERIQKEAFATIRSQSPVMRGINDDARVWAEKWRKEVQMGIIPYYMFMARDTGARVFFDVPMEKAHRIYSDALRNCSGLIRTVRGPSMSCTPGT